MRLRYVVGNHELAEDIAKDNSNYAFVELYDKVIGSNSVFGIAFKKNREEAVGMVISFDHWQCSNQFFNMKCLYEDLARYIHTNKSSPEEIILVGPNKDEIEQAFSYINSEVRKLEK